MAFIAFIWSILKLFFFFFLHASFSILFMWNEILEINIIKDISEIISI